MQNTEFEAEVKNGVIRLPRKYYNAKKAKVIILDNETGNNKDFIFKTVNNPAHLTGCISLLSREEANER